MWKGLVTFILVILVNIFYVYYLNAVKNDKPWLASAWSSLTNLSLSIAGIMYVQNNWIIIPSCIGSFIGTYIGIKLMKMNNSTDK